MEERKKDEGGMSSVTAARRRRAVRAAISCAARFGVHVTHPVVLHDSNHTVVHLLPAPLVAKVNTSPEESSLAGEVEVARFLVARGAPVVPPSSLLPPGPHIADGLETTFWEYCPHGGAEPSPEVLGQALCRLHDCLAEYPGDLRPWDRFDGVASILNDPARLRALPPEERAFLRERFLTLRAAIDAFRPPARPLHGEPHGANLLLSPHGPRWIDFESACLGPQEWDLTVLPDSAIAAHFDAVDWDLLPVLRQMRSLCVAVWCWLDPDRAPVLREAGVYHLRALKDLPPS